MGGSSLGGEGGLLWKGGDLLKGGGRGVFFGGDLLKGGGGGASLEGGDQGFLFGGGGVFGREGDLLPFAADVALGLHPNSLCPLRLMLL